ncbi:RHS repeat-associated core domain-containing protein [Microbacterium xanthum]|uniref:RHS repeat-associated core domain-containing protein n=1 Tax=Microbacterium xanthum TaxID=3079794 RepID=UPI002AD2273D|nr:RHS repeat-associated core domain-containing protein [Microbacterium sp. KSW-48]MDZ8172873.1 RHS repeat-associated core domain-containing protein [Microbacterium sp. KSW-48]
MRAGSSFYYVADHLGSVVGLFSATGTWIGGYSYSPYGEARFTSTSSVITNNALRYIGEHHDGAGIYKLGARHYDAAQGRFTQMDPSGQEKKPYAYAACSPAGSSDPSGLYSIARTAVFGLATGLGAAAGGCVVGGCVVGAIVGSPTGPGAAAGCAFGALTGFVSGAVGGIVTDAVVQGFGY